MPLLRKQIITNITNSSKMNDKNKDYKLEILKILRGNQLSTRDISQEIGTTYSTTLKYLEIMNASFIIENKVFGKTKVWSIKSQNPLELDLNRFFYTLIKNSVDQSQKNEVLLEVLNSFYSSSFATIKEKMRNLDEIELIKRYIELCLNLRWKEITNYEIDKEDNSNLIVIRNCRHKFGCCYQLNEENIPLICMEGVKFVSLLDYFLQKNYGFDLVEFSISPHVCKVKLIEK